MLAPWKKSYDQPRQCVFKSRDITSPTKVCLVKAMVFPVVMFTCDSWAIKKAKRWRTEDFKLWFWRKLLSPLDSKEIKPVNPKGNQPWIFIGRTDAEAEAPVLWPPDAKHWLIGKDPDVGKDWRQEKKGMMTGDEMVGWHHWFNGHEFEKTLGNDEGQENLTCCSPWGRKESNMPEWLNSTELRLNSPIFKSLHEYACTLLALGKFPGVLVTCCK